MPNWKAKGTKGERDLIKSLNESGWSAIRAAGSGSSKYPSPDILTGNAIRRLAIECKVTKDKKKYFSKEEIEQLSVFARNFGAESWVGIRFAGHDWRFFMLEDLEEKANSYVASWETAKIRGLELKELLEHN